jgi:uncharacterized protein (UPF0333 family)
MIFCLTKINHGSKFKMMKGLREKGQAIIEYIFLLTIVLFTSAYILRFIVSEHLTKIPRIAIEALEGFFEKLIEGNL